MFRTLWCLSAEGRRSNECLKSRGIKENRKMVSCTVLTKHLTVDWSQGLGCYAGLSYTSWRGLNTSHNPLWAIVNHMHTRMTTELKWGRFELTFLHSILNHDAVLRLQHFVKYLLWSIQCRLLQRGSLATVITQWWKIRWLVVVNSVWVISLEHAYYHYYTQRHVLAHSHTGNPHQSQCRVTAIYFPIVPVTGSQILSSHSTTFRFISHHCFSFMN
jgi:hypothetical protein